MTAKTQSQVSLRVIEKCSNSNTDSGVISVLTCTVTAGVFSPKSCFSGLGSGAAWLALLLVTCCGGMYHLFRSYFWTIKAFIFCSSLDSGSAGVPEFHSPSQTFLQYWNKWILSNLLWSKMTGAFWNIQFFPGGDSRFNPFTSRVKPLSQ